MTNPSQSVGNQRSISSRSYHKNFESAEAIEIGSPSCKGLAISTEQDERASNEQLSCHDSGRKYDHIQSSSRGLHGLRGWRVYSSRRAIRVIRGCGSAFLQLETTFASD